MAISSDIRWMKEWGIWVCLGKEVGTVKCVQGKGGLQSSDLRREASSYWPPIPSLELLALEVWPHQKHLNMPAMLCNTMFCCVEYTT